MLVLVCGPTGVGKTTLMAALAARAGMRVIETWTTRPPRAGDPFKTSLDAAAYRARSLDFFWPEQRLYGHLYGEDYAAVMAAACPANPQPSLVDMALDTLALFDRVPHRMLVLMPADDAMLVATLTACGRTDRIPKARAEHAAWRAALAGSALAGSAYAEAAVIDCRLGDEAGIAARATAAIGRWASTAADGPVAAR